MAQFQRHFVQELTKPLIVRQCGDLGFSGDNLSDVISVDLYTDGEAYSGGGTCAGACICPDGSTVALSGSVSGKTASVTLKEDCFAIPGQIGIGIRVTTGTIKTTVLKAIYNVEPFATNNPVDPGSRIALDVGDLVNRIDAATADIPASDMASLMAGIAPTFSATTAYPTGAYVYYNGTLYRFTTAHAAGSWTGTDATAVALGNDVADLKSAVPQFINDATGINYYNWQNGRVYVKAGQTITGEVDTSVAGWCCCIVPCQAGDEFYLTTSGASSSYRPWTFVDDNYVIKSQDNSNSENGVITAPTDATKLICNGALANVHLLKSGYITGNLETTDQNIIDLSTSLNATIAELDNRIEENLNDIRNCEYVPIIFESSQFELGSVSNVDGRTIDRDNRIRSIDYVPASDFYGFSLSIVTGYKIAIAYYSANDGTGFISILDFISESIETDIPLGTKYCKFIIADTTDSTSITVNDCDKVDVSYKTKLLEKLSMIPGNDLPDYWADYMNSKLPSLNNNDADLGRYGTSFAFVTDIHVESNAGHSPALLRYIIKNTNIKHIVCGGDIIGLRDTKANAMSELKWWMRSTSGLPIVNLLGNHDLNNQGQSGSSVVISKGEFYALECRQAEDIATFADGKLYGYSDNNNQKIRFIYLDTDAPQSVIIDDTQINWMKARVSELESGWTVVVFAHQFFTPEDKTVQTLEMDGNGTKILDGLNDIYDSVNATIACVIVGHVHRNYSITSAKGFPVIVTTCDTYGRANTYDPDAQRSLGNTTEQAFDLYYLDTYNRTIKVVRIGAGDTTLDRNFTY